MYNYVKDFTNCLGGIPLNSLKQLTMEQKNKLVMLIICSVFSGLAIIGQGYLFVIIIDRIFLDGDSFTEVLPLIYGLLATLLARTAFNYVNGRIGIKMASYAKRKLRKALLDKLSSNPIRASLRGQSGQKVSVAMDTVDEIDSYFSSYIPQVIQSSIIPLMLLIIIFTEHIPTAVIILCSAPFIPIFMMIIGFKTKDKSEEQLDKMAAFSGTFLDTLQGLTSLKLFGRSKQQKEKIKNSSLEFRDATMEVLKVAFMNSLALEFISMLSIGLVALEVAFQMIIFERLSFFTGFLMLILAPEFYTKLKDLGSAFHTGRTSMGAAKKLDEELSISDQQVIWGNERLSADAPPSINLLDAGFSYGEEAFALKNINITIEPFQQVAIIGKTGSGKSTLLNIIAGLVPLSEGNLIIDGKKRNQLLEQDWFDSLSYISQDPYLFSGTIADNIAIGSTGNKNRTEIKAAAEKAGIADLIHSLPKGYDTPIGEAGRGLSGGERQRIAIARAFLKSPSVILFDEPTTGLDLETEQILQASMKELGKKSTIITVAHRLHTIKNADQILLLEDGKLIASGTHHELLRSVEAYKRMITVQQGGVAK